MSNQKQITVAGTVEEWQVLVNLVNAAVKATGLDGAKAGVVWSERIVKAVNEANDSQRPKQVEIPAADTSSSKGNG